jgi:hypothetical protein
VLEVDGDRIRGITSFLDLDSRLFARLGLPEDPPDRA